MHLYRVGVLHTWDYCVVLVLRLVGAIMNKAASRW